MTIVVQNFKVTFLVHRCSGIELSSEFSHVVVWIKFVVGSSEPQASRCVLRARHAPRRSRDALVGRRRRRPCLRASAFRVCPLKLLGRELPPAAQTLLPNSLKPLPSSAGTTSVDFGGRDRGGGGGVRQRRRCDPSVCPSSVRLSVPPFAHPSVRLTT